MKNNLLVSFWLIVGALTAVTLISVDYISSFSRDNESLAREIALAAALTTNLSIMQDIETGQRGFVIAGKVEFLDSYYSGKERLPVNIAQLRHQVAGSPSLRAKMDTLDVLANEKLAHGAAMIKIRRDSHAISILHVRQVEVGKKLMDEYRAHLKRMEDEVAVRLEAEVRNVKSSLNATRLFVLLGGLFSIVVLLFYFFSIKRGTRLEVDLAETKARAELAAAQKAAAHAQQVAQAAESAVKAKQQFLSNMSHEIRTPMNAIIGFTKVVLKTDLSSKQKEYLQAIKMSGDALIVLINDILDLAKVDAGKMSFEQTPFRMSLSISAMLHLFEPKIHEKNLLFQKPQRLLRRFRRGDRVALVPQHRFQ